MSGTLSALFLATSAFVGGHFLLSAPPVRGACVARIGERVFLAVYSLIMIVALIWMVSAFRAAPVVPLWDAGWLGGAIALIVMPLALVLAVVGLIGRNPTALMGDRNAQQGLPVTGVLTVTRHPFLNAAALWALAHLFANGDAAGIILFGGIALLAIGGMAAIDHKRARKLGAAWGAFAAQTSRLPFAAVLSGRTRVDWRGIGILRPALGIAAYLALLGLHRTLFGAAVLPW